MKSYAWPWYLVRSLAYCMDPKMIFAPLGKVQVWEPLLYRAPGNAPG